MIGLVAVVLIFSIPIIAIVTSHFEKQAKLNREMLKDQIELEKLKQENFIMETEKLRLELDKMEQNNNKHLTKF
ncbi:hypothetical protein [Bacillus massiliigorillae]|uniref:hypothetical protein n=1 Tax=Bacillus massiliigorillae TaxID=1243664 RepID=UPI0005AA3923|nr:hypothetical protein [Bacillus massiliigorillae]